jgi:Ca2+-binding EF-hand superfamily protein
VSGAALTAPIHFNDDYPAYTRTTDYAPTAQRVLDTTPLNADMSRADRARLGRHGFFEKVLENYNDVNAIDEAESYNIDTELQDNKLRHEITVQVSALGPPRKAKEYLTPPPPPPPPPQFAAFSATEKHAPLPASVYFTYQLYDKEPTRTERLVLRKSSRKDEDDHTVARVLCREKATKSGSSEYAPHLQSNLYLYLIALSTPRYSPSRTLKYTFDLSMMGNSEAKGFAHYLHDKTLYVDVWDGDALMHVGTMAIPLKKLMRQGRQTSKLARVYDVIAPRGMSEEGGALGVRQGAIGGGPVVGQVQMLLANYGETGKAGSEIGAGIDYTEMEVTSGGHSGDLNWRSNSLSNSLAATTSARPGTPGRARHKVRARPLSESNKDLRKMVKSFGIDGGNLGTSSGRSGLRGGEDMETISYDELMKLCKRFRASQKGRIDYKNSGLLELLDVPDVNRLEKRLVRLLTLAEERGTSLEETFSYLDADNDREMTADDLEQGLQSLKAFEGMRKDEISLLVSRFPRNNNGLVSLNEFISFVRERQPKSPEEDKLRKILKKAEAMGKSVEDIFGFFDKDGSGEITLAEFRDGLNQLGTFSKLTNKEFKRLAKKFDNDGDGKVSLFEFMTFMGKKYNPVESATKKLKAILLKAEEMGTSLSKAFAQFDTDGSGEITIAEFSEGLSSLGVFKDLTQAQVQEVSIIQSRPDALFSSLLNKTNYFLSLSLSLSLSLARAGPEGLRQGRQRGGVAGRVHALRGPRLRGRRGGQAPQDPRQGHRHGREH